MESAKVVPLPVLQQLMGHEDIETTMKYIDVNERQKRDAIAAVRGSGGSAWQPRGSEQKQGRKNPRKR